MICCIVSTFLLLSSQLLSGCSALCPAPFGIEAGRCVFVSRAQSYNWCEANRQCAAIGGELINSYSSLKLLGSMTSFNCSGSTCRMWVGVTDLAEERNMNRTGWQQVNGNGILPPDDSLWYVGMPNSNGNQDCLSTYASRTEFIDLKCTVPRGFACEFVAAAPSPYEFSMSATWKRTPFKRTSYNPSSEYCYKDVLQVSNSIHCMAAAVRTGNCRNVLYNSKLRTCRLLLFTNAQVEEEMENSADWVKFGSQ